MSESKDRPLLTFALVSCNQELFVREAVVAALAQSYSPLQIILSDDCSDDRSFEVMRELAGAYRGPHQVVLNRNPTRKKMGGHMNRVMEISHGALIVIAAADDVSLPQRTQTVYDAWDKRGRRATSLYSDIIQIDESGRVTGQLYQGEELCAKGQSVELKAEPLAYLQTLKPTVHGCAHVISPRLFTMFGNIPDQVMYEDKVLAFRSVLAGQVLYINEPLVKYRLHGANIDKYLKDRNGADLTSLARQENRLQRDFSEAETMYGAFLLDLESARKRQLIGQADFENGVRVAELQHRRSALIADFLGSGFFGKCRLLLTLQKFGISRSDRNILVKRLIPRFLFLRIRLIRSYANLARNRSANLSPARARSV